MMMMMMTMMTLMMVMTMLTKAMMTILMTTMTMIMGKKNEEKILVIEKMLPLLYDLTLTIPIFAKMIISRQV